MNCTLNEIIDNNINKAISEFKGKGLHFTNKTKNVLIGKSSKRFDIYQLGRITDSNTKRTQKWINSKFTNSKFQNWITVNKYDTEIEIVFKIPNNLKTVWDIKIKNISLIEYQKNNGKQLGLFDNPASPQIEELTPEKTKAIESLFNENPELKEIFNNDKNLYSEYLDSIFPDSQVKDIVYHGSDKVFELFKIKDNYGAWFSASSGIARKQAEYMTKKDKKDLVKYSVLLNIKNPKIGFPEGYDSSPSTYLKGYDGLLYSNKISNEVLVVEKIEQIHILGSKQDIKNAKKFINKKNNNFDIDDLSTINKNENPCKL